MALVELTGSVASWGKRIHDQLGDADHDEAAAMFAVSPPFAAADPTTEDYDRLQQHLAVRMQALEDLLSADGSRSM